MQCPTLDELGVQDVKHGVRCQHVQNPAGAVEIERLRLAQVEQARNVVDVGVRENHRLDGTVAQSVRRVQDIVLGDLLAKIGGGVEKHPTRSVGADGDGGLGARPCRRIMLPRPTAVGMVAVPLGVAATCGGAENAYLHRWTSCEPT